MIDSTSTELSLTKEQAMDLAIETCKAREAVFEKTISLYKAKLVEAQGTIERYEKALRIASTYHDTECPAETDGDECECHTQIAREALNPKEGVET